MVVIGIDEDELNDDAAKELRIFLRVRVGRQLQSFHLVKNQKLGHKKSFKLFSVWDEIAVIACENNLD